MQQRKWQHNAEASPTRWPSSPPAASKGNLPNLREQLRGKGNETTRRNHIPIPTRWPGRPPPANQVYLLLPRTKTLGGGYPPNQLPQQPPEFSHKTHGGNCTKQRGSHTPLECIICLPHKGTPSSTHQWGLNPLVVGMTLRRGLA